MWFRSREKQECCPDPFEGKKKCDECKHYCDVLDMQMVIVQEKPFWGLYYQDSGTREKYYCPIHFKSYDKHITYGEHQGFYKDVPQHFERVNEDGSPYVAEHSNNK